LTIASTYSGWFVPADPESGPKSVNARRYNLLLTRRKALKKLVAIDVDLRKTSAHEFGILLPKQKSTLPLAKSAAKYELAQS
jgi:hypothetical protein